MAAAHLVLEPANDRFAIEHLALLRDDDLEGQVEQEVAQFVAERCVITRIDGHRPSQSETGTATAYSYDAQNRLTEIRYADGDWQRFTYNDLGRVKTRAYGNGASTALTLSHYYDPRGQLTKKAVSWTTMPTWGIL